MSICTLCGAVFGCAMADGSDKPCWCAALPPVVAVPDVSGAAPVGTGTSGCWCPACLKQHIAQSATVAPATPSA